MHIFIHQCRQFQQSGFSLLELMAVMVITGILAVTVSVRTSSFDVDLQMGKSDLLAALVVARETAMARHDGNSVITVVTVSSNSVADSVDVQANGVSIVGYHQRYPVSLPDGVSFNQGSGTLTFSSLGETSAHSFVLTDGTVNETVNVSGVGYAY